MRPLIYLCAAMLCLLSPVPAQADRVVQVLQSAITGPVNGVNPVPFNLVVDADCVDGYVEYKLTNKGDDWPKHSFVGIFLGKTNISFVSTRIKMKKGETRTFRVDFKGAYPQPLDFRVNPVWLKQKFQISFRHTPPKGWLVAGRDRQLASRR